MSSEDYRTESVDTTRSSEYAVQRSESDEPAESILYPPSEIEKEIEDEHYDDFKTQVEVLVQLGKQKIRPLQLTDCYTSDRPGMYLEILPKVIFESIDTDTGLEEIEFPKPIFRRTFDQGTIASVEHKSSSAQTLRSNLLNSWSQYEPRLLSEEASLAYINKESFSTFLKTAEKGILDSLVHNKTADCFFRELKSLQTDDNDAIENKESSITMTGSFVCFEGEERQIVKSISWHPVLKDIFIASTQSKMKFEKRIRTLLETPCNTYTSYIWSCNNHFIPKIYLEYFDDITLHKFNPSVPNIIAGGSLNGQLILWNLEQIEFSTEAIIDDDSRYTEVNYVPSVLHHSVSSNPDYSHTRCITDFVWIPSHFEVFTRGNVKLNVSNKSYQIATCGFDGTLKFWDMRSESKPGVSLSKMCRQLDGKWEPFHSVEIVPEDEKKCLSVTTFVLKESSKAVNLAEEPSEEDKPKKNISTEYYAGCDDGGIVCGNFKFSRDDGGKLAAAPLQFFKSPHSGPVTAIALSSFISGLFLSTGSRTIAIWKNEIKETPIYYKDMHARITSAEWSNTRPGLFILGYEDGSIEIWDLMYRIYEPFLIHFVSTTSITAISLQKVSEEEYVMAVGDSHGIVYTLSLPSCLWKPLNHELKLMEEFVEKESLRVQAALMETQTFPKVFDDLEKEKAGIKIGVTDETLTNEILQENYAEFFELQQTQLKYLGIPNSHLETSEENEGENN